MLHHNTTFRTLQGENVTTTIQDNQTYVNNARIIRSDLMISNGVVQVLDKEVATSLAMWGHY
jgi:uncharacterized surface protein with fasciclin (FAS1) repeats